MINKQNLWFITLFSLILVLGIYYLSIGDDSLNVLANEEKEKTTISITESDSLAALRVAEDENTIAKIESYQNTLLDSATTMDEKNEAYDSLQIISKQKSKAEEIEKLIQKEFSLNSFIKFDKDQINITIASKEHSNELANKIIRSVQNLYKEQMYITVKFE